MYSVTKEFKFEAAHCVDGHDGRCRNLHGHSYKVFVTASSKYLNEMEMVIDFKNLKNKCEELLDTFDHAFMFNSSCKDNFEREIAEVVKRYGRRIIELPFRSTAENLSKYFYNVFNNEFKDNSLYISKVTVYETATSYAEYGD